MIIGHEFHSFTNMLHSIMLALKQLARLPKASCLLLAFLFSHCYAVAGDPTSRSLAGQLSLPQIMADPDWIGRLPENPRWADDGETIYFQRKQAGKPTRTWWQGGVSHGAAKRVPLKHWYRQRPVAGDWDLNRENKVIAFEGDLFLAQQPSGPKRKVIQLTRTDARESSPSFLADATQIQFWRDGKLFIRNLTTGLEYEPVSLRFESAPEKQTKQEASDQEEKFLTRKEGELFDYLQVQKAAAKARKRQNAKASKANKQDAPEPYFLGKNRRQQSLIVSDSLAWAAVVVSSTDNKAGRRDNMPVWVQDDAYVRNQEVRSLVGTGDEGESSLVMLNLAEHSQHSIDLSGLPEITTDRLAGLSNESDEAPQQSDDKPGDSADSTQKTDKPDPRQVNVRSIGFSTSGKHFLFQVFSTDNKDRWVCTLRLREDRAPKLSVIHHYHDPAWVNPYGSFNYASWLPGTKSEVLFLTEQSGYSHLMVSDAKGKKQRELTAGEFEVSAPQVSHDGTEVFYRANATHPGEYELYSVDVASGTIRQLTELGGMNEFELSPDQKQAACLHSTTTHPTHLLLVDLNAEKEPRLLADFTSKQFKAIAWNEPEIIAIQNRHDEKVYSRLYLPSDLKDSPQERAAVIFIHGAGYLQNAHKGWSGYFREFMFHTLLSQKGYVVLDMDYRASAGYGRDWRTAIYRQMGTPKLEDLEDGRQWLIDNHKVAPDRVGLYGGSYGGFMTLMALFKRPGVFACGAALRPMTDWAHYNHGYTSNILNEPDNDPTAYEKSSPIYFADGLADPLIMCHGMVDDNVFFKDTVRLAQRLIELEKENWEVAVYPVEPHGFRQPSSWLDEYRRILKLFEQNLQSNE